MNDIEVSSIDLVEGGNVFKQGHYLTLGYVPRDEKGETVDLSGKTLNVSLWGRKGVVFESAATYSGGVIRFTFDKLVAAGDYTVEFTATSSTDAKYRKKFPTNQHSGRIAIKQSADDLGVVGIQVYTVAQLKAEQKALLDAAVSGFTVDSETKMARVSGSTTYTSLPARLEADKQATALQLAEKISKDSSDLSLNNFNETDRAVIQGLEPGTINAVLGEGNVKAINTDFFSYGKNLFNLNDSGVRTDGYFNSSGEFVTHATIGQTGFIPVKEGLNYTANDVKRNVYFYDANKNYLAIIVAASFESQGYVTAPTNAKYAKFQFSSASVSTFQVEQANAPTLFEPYKEPVLKTSIVPKIPVTVDEIAGELTPEKTTFFTQSKNLFDLTDSDVSLNGYYSSDGSLIVSTIIGETGYIPVETSVSYTANDVKRNVYWYGQSKNFISITTAATFESQGYVVPPSGAYFGRFLFSIAEAELFQVEEGEVSTSFESFGSKVTKEYVPDMTKDNYQNLNVLLMGDSITAIGTSERGWPRYFNQIMQPAGYTNVAVSGATWKDKANTPVYDGVPTFNEADGQATNVMGNQVQQVINNNYPAPDVIIIACGTNDPNEIVTEEAIEAQFFVAGENLPVDSADRKTFPGIIRYTVEKLRGLYPDTQIFLCTPLQRANTTGNNNYTVIKNKGDIIKRMGLRLSVPVIDSMESGIYGMKATVGVLTEDYNDGLHLSPKGALKLGEYNARKLINWYCF